MKKCPFCAEDIQDAAIKCKHCGEMLDVKYRPMVERSDHGDVPFQPAPTSTQHMGRGVHLKRLSKSRSWGKTEWFWVIGIISIFVVFVGVISENSKPGKSHTRDPAASTSKPAPSVTSRSSPRVVYAAKVANIRSGPSTSQTVVRKASKGERLVYAEKRGKWYRLSTSATQGEQWIHQSVVLTAAEQSYRDSVKLRVGNWSWQQKHGFAIVEGQVTNVSGSSIKNVTAVVTFQTKNGTFITSDDALIEYNPLLPGQTSPWSVMASWNPAMAKAYVEFKTLLGGTIRSYSE